jgi:hypothetical protein
LPENVAAPVPDFQRHRFDVDRLTIVLALQSALDLILRRRCPEHPKTNVAARQ